MTLFKRLQLGVLTIGLVLLPAMTLAVYNPEEVVFDPGQNAARNTGLGNAEPTEVANGIIRWVLSVLAVIALALIIYAGFIWMFSRGNEDEIARAKGILEGAFFGLVVILASYGITLYVFDNLLKITT